MKNYIWLFSLSFACAFWIVACGNKSDIAVPPAPAIAPVGAPVDGNGCSVGQVFNSQYGCLNQGQCPGGQGQVANTTQLTCVAGTVTGFNGAYGGSAFHTLGSSLRNINRGQFESLMQDYGTFCNLYTYSWGSYSCSAYSNAGYVIVRATSGIANLVNVTIGAGIGNPDYSSFMAWTGTQSTYAMQFTAQSYPINNNLGIELRASGNVGTPGMTATTGYGLVIHVDSGNLTSQSMSASLTWRGIGFANATLESYIP